MKNVVSLFLLCCWCLSLAAQADSAATVNDSVKPAVAATTVKDSAGETTDKGCCGQEQPGSWYSLLWLLLPLSAIAAFVYLARTSKNAGRWFEFIKEIGVTHVVGVLVIGIAGGALLYLLYMAKRSLYYCPDSFDNAKELLGIVLPVIGTWMGTVLAFYFAKDANKSVTDMAKQFTSGIAEKLDGQKAADVMLKPDTMSLLEIESLDAFKTMLLDDVLKRMQETRSPRLVIVDAEGVFLFLIYRETIHAFLYSYAKQKVTLAGTAETIPANELTVAHLLESNFDVIKQILALDYTKYFAPQTATLEHVRQMMEDNSICQDVFITATGSKDEPILGWITNDLLVEKADLFKKAGARV